MHQVARGGEDIDAEHVLAPPNPLARVPTLATLQQVATETDEPACELGMASRHDQLLMRRLSGS